MAQLAGPLADIVSSLSDISPQPVSMGSVLLSGVTVNALAFTFRIAYQKAGCSIFVLVLNVPIAIEQPPFSLEGFIPILWSGAT
ncbi:hypothetical protein CQ062_07360 [Ochrobactrum sp. MYb68]|nr:hypothetical protein CQ062_07360 [Ochrobactrum sp. MYb68]